MNKHKIKKLLGPLYPLLVLEDIFAHRNRRTLLYAFGYLSVIFLAIFLLAGDFHYERMKGAFLLSLSIYLMLLLAESYFYSFYGVSHSDNEFVPFEIGSILFYSKDAGLIKGFMFSDIGDRTMKRLGLEEDEIRNFLISKKTEADELLLPEIPSSIDKYLEIVLQDDSFVLWLAKNHISKEEFKGALLWVVEKDKNKIESERLWATERIARIPVLGKNWSFGETYILEKYGRDITDVGFSFLPSYETSHDPNVTALETILCKRSGANAIVVSDDESSRMDVLSMLADRIRGNSAFIPLSHHRVYVLNPNLIIESSFDKLSFERALVQMLEQSVKAKNIILAIPHFSSFIKSAENIGSEVVSILLPYLESPYLHIIVLDSKSSFHEHLEKDHSLMEHFEPLRIEMKLGEGVMSMLKEEVERIEKDSKLYVTYPALYAISESSRRYFDSFAYPDKAKDVLLEVVPYCMSRGIKKVLPEHVRIIIEARTGVPTGVPEKEEREELLNLEALLQKKVIGQSEAIHSISQAMRRSRSGIRNEERPMGSFLFLGPTGVGKTETAKALAEIFFHSAQSLSRLDMSEYKSADSLGRLIGSFESGKPGILSNILKERPYGVLLLDEFEKTNHDVQNLFLQILDEGFFSDSEGRKVNVRNNIIIATSNAGSDLIWDIVKNGDKLSLKKDEVIDAIIKEGIFLPELINRFDGVILFNPLTEENLREIARLIFGRLAKRITDKGVQVLISDEVVEHIVKKGFDQKFGARPMNRVIQDEIEDLFAREIIKGDIESGSKIRFEMDGNSVIIKTK